MELSSHPDDVPLPELPSWVIALAGRKRVANKRSAGAPATFPEGGRNDGLYKLACSLRAKGLEQSEILPALLAANAERCVPPLDDVEVSKIVASACTTILAPLQNRPCNSPRARVDCGTARQQEEQVHPLDARERGADPAKRSNVRGTVPLR